MKNLNEANTSKIILNYIKKAGWQDYQIEKEHPITAGRVTPNGKREDPLRADYVLYHKAGIPLAIIEVKKAAKTSGSGMQQALIKYANLDVPSVYSCNGAAFLEHNKTAEDKLEKELAMDQFPAPQELWQRYKKYKGIETAEQEKIAEQDYYYDHNSDKTPRYYQQIAINRTVEAIAKGEKRILLTMATGTGKTYTAFQIIHRLKQSKAKNRILFLADRNALIHQANSSAFKSFAKVKTIIKNKQIDKAYEIYFALYQGLTGYEELDAYQQFRPDFFDLIIIDECHRGSADEESNWHKILEYFKTATHLGLTATPKETKDISNIDYFGEPIYTYSLKQGIQDGFLAPYRVLRVGINVDLVGYRPEAGKTDKAGDPIPDREYNIKDYDRNLVIDERTEIVANRITQYLKAINDRFAKTIVFCVDIEHAERMRFALINENIDLVKKNSKYVLKITGDDETGKNELDNFSKPKEKYPVIATTSELLTTGIDIPTCKLIVLESNIQSMTKFKQIIGRGARISEDNGKTSFTIMDFRGATKLFSDPEFDGEPIKIKEIAQDDDFSFLEQEFTEQTSFQNNLPDDSPYELANQDPANLVRESDLELEKGKYYINGVNVSILNEQIQYLDESGKLVIANFKDYTKTQVIKKYATLNDFLNHWSKAEQKQAIIKELDNNGIIYKKLQEASHKDLDAFDLICHTAFDQKPLTRAERAKNVKKRNFFAKYGAEARQVLEALLEKYATEGIDSIEELDILKVTPLKEIGSTLEILKLFGGGAEYKKALKELETEIYKAA